MNITIIEAIDSADVVLDPSALQASLAKEGLAGWPGRSDAIDEILEAPAEFHGFESDDLHHMDDEYLASCLGLVRCEMNDALPSLSLARCSLTD